MVFNVIAVCSVSMDAGDTVPITAIFATSLTKHSAKTFVSGLFLYGTWIEDGSFASARNFRNRAHSFSAYNDALIAAVSSRCLAS